MSIVLSHETRRTVSFHSSAPAVVLQEIPSDLLAVALTFCQPSTAVVLEASTGAGLNLNLLYRDEAFARYSSKYQLGLGPADLTDQVVAVEPVELVHAVLVLEQAADVNQCLDNLTSLVAAQGTLSVVLRSVAASRATLGGGSSVRMVSPVWLAETMAQRGFPLAHQREQAGLWLGIFRRH